MGATVILTGAPGVGKSSIIDELAEQAEKERIKLRVVNFGTTMLKHLESDEKGLHRDQIRRQGPAVQRKIQLEAAKEISRMRGDDVLVIDTHMFIKTPTGALPGLPEDILKELEPSLLILIEAAPEDIARRRSGDGTRKRDQQTLEDVSSDLEWSRKTAAACSVVTGVPVSIIRNEQGRQDEAARQILKMINEVI